MKISFFETRTGILLRTSLIFSHLTMRNHCLFLVLISKHKIEEEEISRSRLNARNWKKEILVLVSKNEIFIQISREKKTYHFKKFWEINSLFLKISVNKQAINIIPKNSRKNCLNLDSRSHIKARDWKKFPFSSQSTRLRERNSRFLLEHEIERKKFSFPSRELK